MIRWIGRAGVVRVRQGPDAAAAARELHARVFVSGTMIFLAVGSSPTDLALMAHEATHVAQQQTVAAARTTIMRDVLDSLSVSRSATRFSMPSAPRSARSPATRC